MGFNTYMSQDAYEYFEYILDSAEATQSSILNVSSLNAPLFRFENPLSEIIGIKIIEVYIPCSYYVVTELNRTFVVNNITTPGTFTVSLAVGTYTPTSLASNLKTQLDSATGLVWAVTFNAVTAKLRFTATLAAVPQTFNFVFGVSGNDGSTNLRIVMGFNSGQTVNSASLVGDNFVDVSGDSYIYVNSETLGPHMNLHLPASSTTNKGGLGPEMGVIPITVNYMEQIVWEDKSSEYVFYTPGINTLQTIDLYLTSGTSFNILDLNGLSFQVKLALLRRKPAFNTQYLGVKRVRAI